MSKPHSVHRRVYRNATWQLYRTYVNADTRVWSSKKRNVLALMMRLSAFLLDFIIKLCVSCCEAGPSSTVGLDLLRSRPECNS